ncbi:MAG: O-antigen ligase family protein, partial [Cyanobacteria bacterium J06634_6]
LPSHIQHLQLLRGYGISKSIDFATISIRNWHPIGHQNYVAGYLILTLPLLLGLAAFHSGKQRACWIANLLVGVAALYMTGSRGAWISFVITTGVFLVCWAWTSPNTRSLLSKLSIVSFSLALFWAISSSRLRGLLAAILTGSINSNGETAYRIITNSTGWFIGSAHPWFGVGLGNVLLHYQKYRPSWAGQEAEITYQLHSTPAQIWAELGFTGTCLTLISVVGFGILSLRCLKVTAAYKSASLPLCVSIVSGLSGYGLYSLTDYQLDNPCISGSLIVFFSAVVAMHRYSMMQTVNLHDEPSQRLRTSWLRFVVVSVGSCLLFLSCSWLYPIDRGWMLSSRGFEQLQVDNIARFVSDLESAHNLVPWEPYYPYQLGWQLGDLAYAAENAQQSELLKKESIEWFERAVEISPNREFGHSSLGWLLVNSDPVSATSAFVKSAQLAPAKRGVFFALGYSLLKQNRTAEAIDAMVVELLRQPIFLTSPIWKTPELSTIYSQILSKLENSLGILLQATNSQALSLQLNQVLWGISWWKGEFETANTITNVNSDLNQLVLMLNEDQSSSSRKAEELLEKDTDTSEAILAWLYPEDNESHLTKALLLRNENNISFSLENASGMVENLKSSQETASSFHEWISQKSPTRSLLNQRSGFGVISRHVDGPLPTDFYPRIENILMTDFFGDLLPSKRYAPELDKLLSPMREELLTQLSES